MIDRQMILKACRESGFNKSGIVNTRDLKDRFRQYHEFDRGSFIICALSCYRNEDDDFTAPGDPHGLIAPFARRNYYKEAVLRLKDIVRTITGMSFLTKRDVRIFCNSDLPEKALAVAGGLGFYGKNGLVIIPGLGSLFIIAGFFLPLILESDKPSEDWLDRGRMCGSCTACIDVCPVGALNRPCSVDMSLCLQALASRAVVFSPELCEKWSTRLYGCQACQDVCPYNRDLKRETTTASVDIGNIGPSISLKVLLSKSAAEIKGLFHGTQMGLSWVSGRAILRNAIVAAGNHRDPCLLPELELFLKHSDPVLKNAAEWAVESIKKS